MQFSLQLSVAHRNSGTATRYKDISQCLTLKIYSNPFFVAGISNSFAGKFFARLLYVDVVARLNFESIKLFCCLDSLPLCGAHCLFLPV